jgi:hypothetical protein
MRVSALPAFYSPSSWDSGGTGYTLVLVVCRRLPHLFKMRLHPNSRIYWAWMVFLFLAVVAQFTWLYPQLRVRDAELSALQATLRARHQSEIERDATGRFKAQSVELARLRKDNQELHRLRNEIRQSRETTQLATAMARAAPAPGPAAAELLGRLQQQVLQLRFENEQLRAAAHQAIEVQEQFQALEDACFRNLRHLDGAKHQWSLENDQPAGALPEFADIEPYLRNPRVWVCPADGLYVLNAVSLLPTCSLHGHDLPHRP